MLGPTLIGHQVVVEAIDQLQAFSRYFLCDVHVKQLQLDELYAVLREIKDSKLGQDEAIEHLERYWVWTAMDPESKLLLVIGVGTRTLAMAQCVMHQVATDGYKDYFTAILTHFGMWVQPSPATGEGVEPETELDAPATAALCPSGEVLPAPAHRGRQAPSGTRHDGTRQTGAFGLRLADQHRLHRKAQPGHPPVCGGSGASSQYAVQGEGQLAAAIGALPGVFQLLPPSCQLTPAPAGSRANEREWFSHAVAAVYTSDGGWADRSWVVAERGTAFSGPTVAAATGVIKGWKDDDRDAEQGSCVCKPTWRAE
jgi:hypothetical protein